MPLATDRDARAQGRVQGVVAQVLLTTQSNSDFHEQYQRNVPSLS